MVAVSYLNVEGALRSSQETFIAQVTKSEYAQLMQEQKLHEIRAVEIGDFYFLTGTQEQLLNCGVLPDKMRPTRRAALR